MQASLSSSGIQFGSQIQFVRKRFISMAVEVLRFAANQNDSLYRTNTPCLYIEDCTADNPSFAGKNG